MVQVFLSRWDVLSLVKSELLHHSRKGKMLRRRNSKRIIWCRWQITVAWQPLEVPDTDVAFEQTPNASMRQNRWWIAPFATCGLLTYCIWKTVEQLPSRIHRLHSKAAIRKKRWLIVCPRGWSESFANYSAFLSSFWTTESFDRGAYSTTEVPRDRISRPNPKWEQAPTSKDRRLISWDKPAPNSRNWPPATDRQYTCWVVSSNIQESRNAWFMITRDLSQHARMSVKAHEYDI